MNSLLPDVYILHLQPIQSPYRMFGMRRTIPPQKKTKKNKKESVMQDRQTVCHTESQPIRAGLRQLEASN